jgi:primosomal protein N' (replication factor Y)
MQRHLEAGTQVLVYLNRRGYAPTLLCQGCGWIAPCHSCDARMTVHQRSNRLACHHCGADEKLPERCPRCGHEVHPLGHGTERVEETLAQRFPAFAIERFDRDALRQQQQLEGAIDRVHSGSARILVGTQMLTKGHHFPGVTLVGVLNADQSLFSTDFRAAERLAQTIVQVAGRAGRAERPGEVLIQSEYPDHPLLTTLLESGYAGRSDGITSFARDAEGRIYVLVLGSGERVLELTADEPAGRDVPERLSQTGLFEDMDTLRPAPGVSEYEVAAPGSGFE